MKFSGTTPAILALLSVSAVSADECCWPVNPLGVIDLNGVCDLMVSGDLLTRLFPLLPTTRRLEVDDEKAPEAGVVHHEHFSVKPKTVKENHDHGRDLLALDPLPVVGEAIATGCSIPLLSTYPALCDPAIFPFQCPDPYAPSACYDCTPDPWCMSLQGFCAILMNTDITFTVLGYGDVTVNFESTSCAGLPYAGYDCCVKMSYDASPGFLAWVAATYPTIVIPPQFIPLTQVLAAGLAKLSLPSGEIDLSLPKIFKALCVPLAGDLCCSARGGLCGGDPHIQTWSGDWYDFHGECDLVFVSAPEFRRGLGLDIQIRTTARYDYSFIEGAAVRIGDDVLEVYSHGEYFFNGISGAAMPVQIADQFTITKTTPNEKETILTIQVKDDEQIVVSTFKDLVTVKFVNATADLFGKSSGLLGDFESGARLGRDGVTVYEDMNAFGLEWQVRDTEKSLFQVERAPQYPQKCYIPKPSTKESRRLGANGITREEAEAACAHVMGEAKEMCVFDVLSTGDLDMAQAGAY